MQMTKIVLKLKDGTNRKVTPGETRANAEGKCPLCKALPFSVAGDGAYPGPDDASYECRAFCLDCGERVGTIVAKLDTIFGVREDERVLYGMCRVY